MSTFTTEDLKEMLLHPDLQPTLLLLFENFCASSVIKPARRIAELEETVEELEAKMEILEDKLKTASERIPEDIIKALPSTVTDVRTDHLVEYIEDSEEIPEADSGFENLKVKYMNSKWFRNFITSVLPEQLRPKSFKNLRKLKKDLFENAVTRYGDRAEIDKADHGNKELRLVIARVVQGVSGTR